MITIAKTKNLNKRILAAYDLGIKNGKTPAILELMKSLKEELDNHKCQPRRKCVHCMSLRTTINLIGRNI
jgi:hypothetical protein